MCYRLDSLELINSNLDNVSMFLPGMLYREMKAERKVKKIKWKKSEILWEREKKEREKNTMLFYKVDRMYCIEILLCDHLAYATFSH